MQTQNTNKEKKEVLIIGAGIAGISAAKVLQENGYSPIILEAQDKIGGRIKTNRSLGFPFDEGASWIHGIKDNPISEIAEQAKADTFWTNDLNTKIYDIDGTAYSSKLIHQEEREYNLILQDFEGDRQSSFATAFYEAYPQYKENRLWTYMLSAFLEFDTGGDIHHLSAKYFYDDEAFEGKDLLISSGYDTIPNYLAKGLDICLETIVKAIDYSGEKITVTTNNKDYQADLILVTVPLGVLKNNYIQFTPVLPKSIQTAIDDLAMGNVNKFLFVWEDAFWEEKLQYIGYTPEEKGKFNFFLNLKNIVDTNALVTFTFGDYAIETERLSDDAIISTVMSHLRAIYGQDIPNPSHFIRTNWNASPYTKGAYSFVPKETKSKLFNKFKKSVKRRLFFAGEHTSKDCRGTVHGAYLSGIRAARQILRIK